AARRGCGSPPGWPGIRRTVRRGRAVRASHRPPAPHRAPADRDVRPCLHLKRRKGSKSSSIRRNSSTKQFEGGMEPRLHGPQGHLEAVGDGLKVEAVDEPQEHDLLLNV